MAARANPELVTYFQSMAAQPNENNIATPSSVAGSDKPGTPGLSGPSCHLAPYQAEPIATASHLADRTKLPFQKYFWIAKLKTL